MHVKISTATVWEGERYEADSVIEVPAEVFELNSAWMKATDEPLTKSAAMAKKSDRS